MRQQQGMFLAGLCLALITFYGCASGGTNYRKYKTVSADNSAGEKDVVFIDTKTCKKVAMSAVRVYQDGDDTIVKGDIKKRNPFQPSRGHVQVVVVSSDGKNISKVKAAYYPNNSPGKPRLSKKRTSTFTARLPLIIPHEAIVRIVCGG